MESTRKRWYFEIGIEIFILTFLISRHVSKRCLHIIISHNLIQHLSKHMFLSNIFRGPPKNRLCSTVLYCSSVVLVNYTNMLCISLINNIYLLILGMIQLLHHSFLQLMLLVHLRLWNNILLQVFRPLMFYSVFEKLIEWTWLKYM